MVKPGRRAQMLATDSRPGQILALGLAANAPVFAGFVLGPVISGGDPAAARAFVPWVVALSAPLAVAGTALYFRTSRERRQHRAARIGLLLSGVALALWAFVVTIAAR